MAISIPAEPSFVTRSEEIVWERLCEQLPDDCVVFANLRVTDEGSDREADFVVLMPGSGVVVIEVKGGQVWVNDYGEWFINRYGRDQRIYPVDQARNAKHALRKYVASDPRWGSRRHVRWDHHVVLAWSTLPEGFSRPDCLRWQVSDKGDLGELGARIWDATSLHNKDAKPPDAEEVDRLRLILSGRGIPRPGPRDLAENRARLSDRLTMEQTNLLRVTRLLNRVEIRGGAGSGKTVLAIRQARDLAGGVTTDFRQRVAVVCYSYGLAHHLRRELLHVSEKERPVFVGTFEDLARRWGIEITGSRDDSDYWERRLPELMAERAEGLTEEQRFDSIIVDEAQDFADDWWTPLVASLRDEETGGLYAYSDERQRVFERFGRPPIALVPLVLDHNMRNTRQIAESFAPLAPVSMIMRGAEGPDVKFVACSTTESIGVADDQVEELLEEGWEPSDVALLTTGSRHPVQVERQEQQGFDAYWEDFWSNDDVFYGHVLGFKGMERRAVVLCLNEEGRWERSRERLYVGLSRATDRLVVVGDPSVVERIGGREVLERLTAVDHS